MSEHDVEQDGKVVGFRGSAPTGGFVLAEAAPQDKPTKRRVSIYEPDKGKLVGVVNIEYFVSRVNTKPTTLTDEEMEDLDPDDEAAINSRKMAKSLAHNLHSWDMYGDDAIPGFVGSHEIVPLTPEMIEFVPLWVRNQIFDELMELVNPNLKRSRGSRRR